MKYRVVMALRGGTAVGGLVAGRGRPPVGHGSRAGDCRQLERKPSAAGESRGGTVRILIEPPLAVHFEVVEDDVTVYVLAVRWFGIRHQGD
jgi:hypothetical protein